MSERVDVARIAHAVGRPGIDPRSFISKAVVTAVSVEPEGIFCDIILLPSAVEEHATLAPLYGGPGYGLYVPVQVDDLVIVACPEGDPGWGYRIIARVWDAGDPPPPDVAQHPADVVLVVKRDAACRIVTDGAGDVIIAARGTGKVRLGGETGGAGVARLGDDVTLSDDVLTGLQTKLDARYQLRVSPPPATVSGVTGTITSASTKVEST